MNALAPTAIWDHHNIVWDFHPRSKFGEAVRYLKLPFKRVGREYMSDLLLLCRNCHSEVHKLLEVDGKFPNLWKAAKLYRAMVKRKRRKS